MKPLARIVFLFGLCWLTPASRGGAAESDGQEFFEKKVRPVLVEHCYACHSAGAKKLKGGLLLDSREGLVKGGDTGPALVPGQPAASRMIDAIGYQNVELRMPPRGKLPATAVAELTSWVKMGAPWPKERASASTVARREVFDLAARKASHWAWQPVRDYPAPAMADASWPLGPVDGFILAQLEARGLHPAVPADRRTLLRRLYFDLIGLPPAPADVETFVHDSAPDALERVADRLLASEQFGERWGRHWLDLVRYAESRGHEFDYTTPNAYQYRDYVIRAVNADLPYDQFVTEHLAGDLLARSRRHPVEGFNESILGTGFWYLGEQEHSPVDLRQDEADRLDNMVDVFSKTFLGLTVACARCHDHKFDAISTRDYYALYGFLESSSYRQARFDTLAREQLAARELEKLREQQRPLLQRALAEALRPGVERMVDLPIPSLPRRGEENPISEVSAGADVVVDYRSPAPDAWLSDGCAFGPGPVESGLPRFGEDPTRPIVSFVEQAAAEYDRSWKRLREAPGTEAEPGVLGKVPRPGRTLRTPSLTLTASKLFYLVRGTGHAYAAVDSHVMIAGPLHGRLVQSIKTDDEFTWVMHDLSAYRGQRLQIEFVPARNAEFAVALVVQANTIPAQKDKGQKTKNEREDEASFRRRLLDTVERLAQDRILHTPDAAEYAPLANWLVQHQELFVSPEAARKLAEVARPALEAQKQLLARLAGESRLAPAMLDSTGVDEAVFIRGSPRALGPRVPRRFLETLAGPQGIGVAHGSGRLELAQQVTDPTMNPFITRVLVNRIWHHLFGRGLVPSVDNFGVLGEPPTHPELLDTLATQFVRDGWSIKKLIRRLVLSRTYQMSSRPDVQAEQVDAGNRLLHRMRTRRLEGEAIRDAILTISGRADFRRYGPAVPVYLTPFQDGRGRPTSGPLDGAGRRSIYLAVRRNFVSPFLLAFDTPAPLLTVGRRTVSNVPAQALILMNDPFVHQQAELWARRVLVQHSTNEERVVAMYEAAFARLPLATELASCREFVERAHSDDIAAWVDLAHVLFNMKELIYLN